MENNNQAPQRFIGLMKRNSMDLINRLESMPFEEAREKILKGDICGTLDSQNHMLCLSWLQLKESEFRDKREAKSLSISRKALSTSRFATRIAISAIVLSIIMAIWDGAASTRCAFDEYAVTLCED